VIPRWPPAYPATGLRAGLKCRPEDFRVFELPEPAVDHAAGRPAAGPGPAPAHVHLYVEKCGLTSAMAASQLAAAAGVAGGEVGYAGMKDRHAVTRQWFSLPWAAGCGLDLSSVETLRVLATRPARRKLRRGDHAGNRFEVRLRGLDGEGWAERLAQLDRDGVPNYFGPQRFGGSNLSEALAWLPERRRRRLPRFRQGLYLSVLRSYLFNAVLAARVADGSWQRHLPGDVLDDSGRPTGPLWGRGRSPTQARARCIETAALAPHAALCEALEYAGLQQDRRPLQLVPEALHGRREGQDLLVDFRLPPGGYATVLLGELAELQEPERGGMTSGQL